MEDKEDSLTITINYEKIDLDSVQMELNGKKYTFEKNSVTRILERLVDKGLIVCVKEEK